MMIILNIVVICSHFSIFGTLETTYVGVGECGVMLWFALILVSLEHWKQHLGQRGYAGYSCDLLSF